MRVVIDTNVLIASRRSVNGASNEVLRLVAAGRLLPLMTIALYFEYEAVLKRPEQVRVHGLSPRDIDAVLASLVSFAIPVDVRFRWRPQLLDPKDELVLDAAVNGQADALVTHNVRDFEPSYGRFGIKVLRPGALLEQLRS